MFDLLGSPSLMCCVIVFGYVRFSYYIKDICDDDDAYLNHPKYSMFRNNDPIRPFISNTLVLSAYYMFHQISSSQPTFWICSRWGLSSKPYVQSSMLARKPNELLLESVILVLDIILLSAFICDIVSVFVLI